MRKDQITTDLNKKENEIESLSMTRHNLRAKLNDDQQDVGAKDAEINHLERQLASHEKTIQELKQERDAMQQQFTKQLANMKDASQTKVAILTSELQALKTQEQNFFASQQTAQLVTMELALQKKATQEAEKQSAEYRRTIQNLQAKLLEEQKKSIKPTPMLKRGHLFKRCLVFKLQFR